MKALVPVAFVAGAVAFAHLGLPVLTWASLTYALVLGFIQAPK